MHADKHIQQIFNGNSIKDPSDLAALYKEAAKIGFSSPFGIVEESGDGLNSLDINGTTTSITKRRDDD